MSNEVTLPYSESEINAFVETVETDLMTKEKFEFSFDEDWKINFPERPGVYAIFENGVFIYIGETSELRARMYDLRNTYNHTFRNKIGELRLNGVRIGNKYSDEIEESLNAYFENNIEVSFHALSFGRKEVEARIIEKHKEKLVNSVSLRGVKSKIKKTFKTKAKTKR